MVFLGVLCMYLTRICLSPALIPISKIYGWNEVQQGYLNAAFYGGYLSSQFIGGMLSRKFGGKPVALLSIFLSSMASIVSPFLASQSGLFISARLVMGLGQGMSYSSMIQVLSHWSVPAETSTSLNVAWSGGQVGTILVLALYSPIFELAEDWRVPFIVFGIIGLLWCCAWAFVIVEYPKRHPNITPAELIYITRCNRETKLFQGEVAPEGRNSEKNFVPYNTVEPFEVTLPKSTLDLLAILFSPAAITLYVTYFTFNWTFYLLLNNLPKYLTSVLGIPFYVQGYLLMIPYLLFLLISAGSAVLADHLVTRGVNMYKLVKIYVLLGFLVAAIVLILMPFLQNTSLLLVSVFIVTSVPAIAKTGFAPAVLRLSTSESALMTSICYFVVGFAGILCPLFSGWILQLGNCHLQGIPTSIRTKDQRTGTFVDSSCMQAWNIIFIVSAVFFIIGAVAWLAFSDPKHKNSESNQSISRSSNPR